MENITKIEQVGEASTKLDAVIKVSKTVEVARNVTFMGLVSELAAIVQQADEMERRKRETIDLLASVAVAQGYSEEEIAIINERIANVDAEKKASLLSEIQKLAAEKVEQGGVEVVGDIEQGSIVPPKVEAIEESEPTAPVDPTPVTAE